jgi:hypothetical protein
MPAERNLELMRLVNRSPATKRETLRALGLARSTFLSLAEALSRPG